MLGANAFFALLIVLYAPLTHLLIRGKREKPPLPVTTFLASNKQPMTMVCFKQFLLSTLSSSRLFQHPLVSCFNPYIQFFLPTPFLQMEDLHPPYLGNGLPPSMPPSRRHVLVG